MSYIFIGNLFPRFANRSSSHGSIKILSAVPHSFDSLLSRFLLHHAALPKLLSLSRSLSLSLSAVTTCRLSELAPAWPPIRHKSLGSLYAVAMSAIQFHHSFYIIAVYVYVVVCVCECSIAAVGIVQIVVVVVAVGKNAENVLKEWYVRFALPCK